MIDAKKELESLGYSINLANLSGYIVEDGKFVHLAEYNRTFNKRIETFDEAIELVKKFKVDKDVKEEEKEILYKLVKELIKEHGVNERTSEEKKAYRSFKTDRLASRTTVLKNEIKDLDIYEEPVIIIKDVNDWIKSLKIFKVDKKKSMLVDSYYEKATDLYEDIKKMVEDKNISAFKLLYIKMIIKELTESKYNRLLKDNYLLSTIINIIKKDEKINEKINNIQLNSAISERIQGSIIDNKVKMILRNE